MGKKSYIYNVRKDKEVHNAYLSVIVIEAREGLSRMLSFLL